MMFHESAYSKWVGVYGRLYDIDEPDLIKVMMSKMQQKVNNGDWAKLKVKMRKKMDDYIERPPGILLPPAQKNRLWYYQPITEIADDIRDHEGNLMYKKGTRVNPLDYIKFSKDLVFFDSDQPNQVAWVKEKLKQKKTIKLILINGELKNLVNELDRPIYHDHIARLHQRMNIQALPAYVSQSGNRLKVEEITLDYFDAN